MSKIDPELAKSIKEKPHETYRVIVRVLGDMDERQAQLEAFEFTISRRLRLIRGFGAAASGSNVHRAAEVEWIVSIERDQEVKTMPGAN